MAMFVSSAVRQFAAIVNQIDTLNAFVVEFQRSNDRRTDGRKFVEDIKKYDTAEETRSALRVQLGKAYAAMSAGEKNANNGTMHRVIGECNSIEIHDINAVYEVQTGWLK